jgi:hypothetical protein
MTKLLRKTEYPALKGLWTMEDILKHYVNKEAGIVANYERPLCKDTRVKQKVGFKPGLYNFVLGLRPWQINKRSNNQYRNTLKVKTGHGVELQRIKCMS